VRVPRLSWLVLACATAIAATPVRADANPRAEQGEEGGCELAAVKRRIAELLGVDPFVPDAAVVVLVSVERRGTGYEARLDVTGASGDEGETRVLSARSCAELKASLAVVIALVLRSHGSAPPPAGEPGEADGPDPGAAEPVRDEAPDPPPPVARTRTTRATGADLIVERPAPRRAERPAPFALLVAGAAGHAGGWQTELRAGARVRSRRHSLALELHLRPDEEIAVADSTGGIAVRTTALSVTPCAHLGHLAACGLAMGGWVRGSGRDLVDARTARHPLAALGGLIAWEQGLGAGIAARLFADIRGNLTRTRFAVDHMAVWSSPRVEAWLGLGLLTEIP
jgi:hypothetical protein